MSFTKANGLMLTALLVTLGSTVVGSAQQPEESVGLVRITDGRGGAGARSAGPRSIQQMSGCQTNSTGAPCSSGNCQSGGVGSGSCPNGSCPSGGYGGAACNGGRCQNCRGCLSGGLCQHCCKHSPDYGYSPPAKYPLHRRGVEYTNYYPSNWYGAGADYSQSTAQMVYMPTDTTQLGFTYQHVPFWQPQPSMMPQRPIPAQWHVTAPAVHPSRYAGNCFGNAGMNGCGMGRNGGQCFGEGQCAVYPARRIKRNYFTGSIDIYDETGTCPPEGCQSAGNQSCNQSVTNPQMGPSPITPMQPQPVPPASLAPMPNDEKPKAVESYDSDPQPDPAPEVDNSAQTNAVKPPEVLPQQSKVIQRPPLRPAIRQVTGTPSASNQVKKMGYNQQPQNK